MNKVDISCSGVDSLPWLGNLENICLKILNIMQKNGWEVSILFCNDAYIKELNKKYRGIDKPTDVLAFSQVEGKSPKSSLFFLDNYLAGDIVISVDTLKNNCKEYSVQIEEELRRLLIHGLLHLDGYEHKSSDFDDAMICLQEKILKKI